MMSPTRLNRIRRALPVVVAAAGLLAGACASSSANRPPAGTLEPDRFLYERGLEELADHKWVTAREFFTEVFEGYSQSAYRPDAKLGIGDSFMGEGGADGLVNAISHYREFLTFYPTHARADYAQFQLALAHFRQMRGPQRDQSETLDTITEFEAFLSRYPNSDLAAEARDHLREAKDRLGEHEFGVGLFYYRIGWWAGAIERFKDLLTADPDFSGRDKVYYYLGETLRASGRNAEALPYYARLVDEFQQSDRLDDARKRIAELTDPAGKEQP
jgi:outer membrane protein assembly factor BamD